MWVTLFFAGIVMLPNASEFPAQGATSPPTLRHYKRSDGPRHAPTVSRTTGPAAYGLATALSPFLEEVSVGDPIPVTVEVENTAAVPIYVGLESRSQFSFLVINDLTSMPMQQLSKPHYTTDIQYVGGPSGPLYVGPGESVFTDFDLSLYFNGLPTGRYSVTVACVVRLLDEDYFVATLPRSNVVKVIVK